MAKHTIELTAEDEAKIIYGEFTPNMTGPNIQKTADEVIADLIAGKLASKPEQMKADYIQAKVAEFEAMDSETKAAVLAEAKTGISVIADAEVTK